MAKRIRRSFLFAPADNPEMMEKTGRTGADAVIFDLEDAISKSNIDVSRDHIQEVTEEVDFGETEVCVRINSLRTRYWLRDIEAVVNSNVDTILLPMVEDPWELRTTVETLSQFRAEDRIEIGFTMETPQGILNGGSLSSAARELDPVTAISFGIGDYTSTLGAPEPSLVVRDNLRFLTSAYASIGRLDPIASIYPDIADIQGLRENAQRALKFGFIGAMAIYPDQVEVLNDVFTPDEQHIEELRVLLEEFEKSDKNSVVVNGVFLDTANVPWYRKQIDRYEETN